MPAARPPRQPAELLKRLEQRLEDLLGRIEDLDGQIEASLHAATGESASGEGPAAG